MLEHDGDSGEVPLLELYPLFQRLIFGSLDKKHFLHPKSHMVILLALSLRGVLNMTQIAQFLSSSGEQATRSVAPLADEGYVERSVDPQNRTHVLIRLTDKGKEYISARSMELQANLNGRLDKSLTPEERDEFKTAVNTVGRFLEKIE